MNYTITHVTRYSYRATVELTTGVLRLKPVSRDGQVLERFTLRTDPPCLPPEERIDPFGNAVLSLRIEKPHRELAIEASSRVRIDRPPVLGLSPPWEEIAAEALTFPSLAFDSPALGLFPSRALSLFDKATAYARESFTAGRPVYEAAMELTSRIRADFVYDPEATEVSTPAHVAFEHRHGVCQDFANIMIAALRGLGLPALYVSGYIRTTPPPGKPRLAGADASHAWASVWCGASLGWLDFDPTNALAIQNDHVEVARGRDYTDASPIESMVLSSGSHELKVEVDVVPV
ncbi:transglutaminase-like putative cysteine protease [Roseiarcus fermentans]|uniref:Transglutaminase-like putative cysteine protease n=1 Tax=Roseiarcus fermentans TaxID=1473586 RepID=A0A366FMH6_9HYPH|nr:transglutaminase family protein [Roseiarcus fermentans]RBP15838.1 transglutaminase-like putative cysteine protease [Roseiarcus fermentans]